MNILQDKYYIAEEHDIFVLKCTSVILIHFNMKV